MLETNSLQGLHQGQVAALRGVVAHFKVGSKPDTAIVVMPTGAGKSGVAALVPYLLSAKRVLVLTPSVIITKQLAETYWGEGGTKSFYQQRGLITAAEASSFVEKGTMHTKSLTDSSLSREENVQRVVRAFESSSLTIINCHKIRRTQTTDGGITIDDLQPVHDKFDLVIVDEAHHYPAPTWRGVVDKFQGKKVFITATPSNKGQAILGASMEDQANRFIAYEMSRQQAVASGIIRDSVFVPVSNAAESDVIVSTDPRAIREVIFQMFRELSQHQSQATAAHSNVQYQGMILCRLKEDADLVRDMINAYLNEHNRQRGFPPTRSAECIHGSQNQHLKNFTAGKFRILVTCGKAGEGYDNSRVSVIGIIRHVTSPVFFNQFVGRVVRKAHAGPIIQAKVISHILCNQEAMFKELTAAEESIAQTDPVDPEPEPDQ